MNTLETSIVKTRTFAKPTWGRGMRMITTLRTSDGYFSATAEIGANGTKACGCLHEEILKSWPTAKIIVDLHLSDLEGIPLHAEANGWHWLAKAAGITEKYGPNQPPEECLSILCGHLRITSEEANKLVTVIQASEQPRKAFSAIVEAMKPRWAKEAQAGLEFLSSL